MKIILSILFCVMLKTITYGQSWELTEELGGFITDIEFDGGSRYVVFKTGEIFRNDTLLETVAVQTANELGLHSVVRWNGLTCICFSALDNTQMVRCGEDTILSVPYISPLSNRHRGGDMLVSSTGILFVGFGHGGNPNHAQDSTDYRGKIVAVEADTSYIYAYGLRNPWKMAFNGNSLYIADVGDRAWEEVNRIDTAGINLGWPCYEGYAVHDTVPPCGPTMGPLYTYPRITVGNAIIGGTWYQEAFWWCDNYYEFGGRTYSNGYTDSIPCPQYPVGMYSHNDTLYVYEYTGKIYRWEELPLALDSVETDTFPKETREEREYQYWVDYMIQLYGGDPYMTMDRKIVNGLPQIPGIYYSLIRRKGYVVVPNY